MGTGLCQELFSTRAAILLAAALLAAAATMLPSVQFQDEAVGLSWLFLTRGAVDPPQDVAVVSIDGESALDLGLSSQLIEWPRELHARLIDGLVHSGAKAIAFDIIFDRPRDREQDRQLAESLQRAGNVILVERVRTHVFDLPALAAGVAAVEVERRIPPIEPLRRAAVATAPFVLPAVPVSVRQFWVFGRGPGDTATLPAIAVTAHLDDAHARLTGKLYRYAEEHDQAMRVALDGVAGRPLHETVLAIRSLFRERPALATALMSQGAADDGMSLLLSMYAGPDSRYLNFYGPPRTVPTYAFHELLREFEAGNGVSALRGQTVFVGFSESHQPEQQDSFHSVYTDSRGLNLSGVEIAATAFANLLHGHEVRPLSVPQQLLLTAIWGLALVAACLWLSVGVAALVILAATSGYLWMAVESFASTGLWLPLVVPVAVQAPSVTICALVLAYVRARRQRQRVREALGYYVPADEVERLTRDSLRAGSDGRLLHGACLFTDADQYTTLAESLSPRALAQLLNDYYAVLFDAVRSQGGQIADVAGDSMVAVWADVRPDSDTRSRACAAALAVQRRVREFNALRGQGAMSTRVGLDAGPMLLGNIGAGDRFEYRAVGEIVNTASRLQGLNRQLGTRVLASAATLAGLGHMPARHLGAFVLVGKAEPLNVYELTESGGREPWPSSTEAFEAIVRLVREGHWRVAAQQCERLLARCPDDGPTHFYLALVQRHQFVPPVGWDGAVRLTAK